MDLREEGLSETLLQSLLPDLRVSGVVTCKVKLDVVVPRVGVVDLALIVGVLVIFDVLVVALESGDLRELCLSLHLITPKGGVAVLHVGVVARKIVDRD